MIGESLLALAAVLACTAGFISAAAWHEHYASWNVAQGLAQSRAAFINGSGLFISQFGVPEATARAFVALVAVSFALTTLDGNPPPALQHPGSVGDAWCAGPRPTGHRRR